MEERIRENLRVIREVHGMSHRKVSLDTEVNGTQLSRLYNNKYYCIAAYKLVRLDEYLINLIRKLEGK